MVHACSHLILGLTRPRARCSMWSATTLQSCSETSSSSSSSGSSDEMQAGRLSSGAHVPTLREDGTGSARPAVTARNIIRQSNVVPMVSDIQRCHVTGFVNFVEGQPSVGRFRAVESEHHEQPPSLPTPPTPRQMSAGSPTRTKIADTVAPTIAPECNYGVLKPAAGAGTDNVDFALPPPRSDDSRG